MMQKKTSQVLTGVLFIAVTAPCVAIAQGPLQVPFLGFADPDLILTGKVPYHVKAMDLDGINGIDLVVANKGNPADPAGSPPSIETFLSDGMGGFTLGQVFDSFFVTEPRQLATGFVDSDNVLDLVVADGRGNRIVVFFGVPGGGFGLNPRSFPVPDLPVMSVDLGLINGDNFLDAVTGNFNVTHQLGRLFGDGTGNFGQTTLFDFGLEGSIDPTVFVSLGMANQVVSIENPLFAGEPEPVGGITLIDIDSAGVFSNPKVFHACNDRSPVRPTAVRIDDVNNNGVPDLIIAANGIPQLTFDYGNGIFFAFEGVFEFPVPGGNPVFKFTKFIPTPSPRPFDIAIADVNGDQTVDRFDNVVLGNKDIVITHWNATTGQINDFVGNADLTVLIDDGSGNNIYDNDIDDVIDGHPFEFAFSVLGSSTAQDVFVSPRFVELVDIDGDGDLDIITTRTRNDERSDDQPNGHIAFFRNLTILNADLNGDSVMDAADLAILLGNWGSCTCFSDIDGDVNGAVNAADMAILLANWTGDPQGAMAQPGDMAFDDTNIFKDGSGTNQPNQNVTAAVPWVVAHFGFDSIASYTNWLDLLTEAELFNHIAAMLDLISTH